MKLSWWQRFKLSWKMRKAMKRIRRDALEFFEAVMVAQEASDVPVVVGCGMPGCECAELLAKESRAKPN